VIHQLLFYDYVGDVVERRAPHRDAHLEALRRERDAGSVVLAGAFGDPIAGAAIVFAGVDATYVERFAAADPYVLAGLVRSWRVEPYAVAIEPRSAGTGL
jgi:uncharacterized protein YciI